MGRRTTEQHLPLHDLSAAIEKFAANPPSTPSRPPAAVDEKTIGKGKTILNWQAAEQAAGALPQQPGRGDAAPSPRPQAADKRTQRVIGPASVPPRPTAPSRAPAPRAVPSTKKTVQMAGLGAPTEPPPESPTAPENVPPVPDVEIGSMTTPAVTVATSSIPPRRSYWKAAVALGAIVLLTLGAVIFFAVLPSGSPPQPVPRPAAPPVPTTGTTLPPAPPTARPTPPTAPPPAPTATVEPPPTAGPPSATPAAEPAPAPAPEPPTATEPEPAPPAPAPTAIEPAPEAPTVYSGDGDEQRFPGHFRQSSATFWFSDEVDGLAVVDQLKGLGAGDRVKIVGHPTKDEVAAGQGSIGLSRAWAVEKYLVRSGVDPAILTPVRGRAVEARADLDDRGWPQSRWVGLIIE
jgi:hypothetical protein